MGVFGPLPTETVGLVLGKSGLNTGEITMIPGIVDADYQRKIMILTQEKGIQIFTPGIKIAQLLLFAILGCSV